MKIYPHPKECNEWVLNLSGAIVGSVASDYKKALKQKRHNDRIKQCLINEHKNLQKDVKTQVINGSQFVLRSAALKDERKMLAKSRKKNQSKIESLESWFLSDWGNMLSLEQGQYIIKRIRNEMI